MYYDNNFFESFIDWVFSFTGIITIALIALAIWLIYRYFEIGKKKNEDNNDLGYMPKYYPSNKKTIYDDQSNNVSLNDESLWDNFKKSDSQQETKSDSQQETNTYPTREEEPIPPNAIPPSHYFEEEPLEELDIKTEEKLVERSEGLYEKQVTKKVIEDDVLFDDIKEDDIPIDEPIIVEKKENE
jgi:hypothetical protein